MTFDPGRLDHLSARRLLDFAASDDPWLRDDPADVLARVLNRSAMVTLHGSPDAPGADLGPTRRASLSRSLGAILQDPQTTADELNHIKNVVRNAAAAGGGGTDLSKELATLVYFVCIALLMNRFGDGRTALNTGQLRRGLQWVVALDWSPAWMAQAAHESLRALDSGQWD
jgi:hypothetical protein